jgi:hypothetical protein
MTSSHRWSHFSLATLIEAKHSFFVLLEARLQKDLSIRRGDLLRGDFQKDPSPRLRKGASPLQSKIKSKGAS